MKKFCESLKKHAMDTINLKKTKQKLYDNFEDKYIKDEIYSKVSDQS